MSEAVQEPVPIERPTRRPPGAMSTLAGLRFRRLGTTRWRFVKAYLTTFVVIASYLRLTLLARIFGREFYESNLSRIHTLNAQRIERTVIELQGLFIKVGQLISIMTNFLPEEFRKPLESLQDQVPPRPIEEITRRIEEELGAPPEKLFATFDRMPLASASLGQVHRATLQDGTQVVVKVQHADIDEIVHMDLKTIWRIMIIVRWFVPIQGMDLIYRQVQEMILQELDFEREAAFMEKIGMNLETEHKVTVPTLYSKFCTARVMTTSYIAGVKVSDLPGLDTFGIDRAELARRLVRAYCKMIFVDGLYHADPHPGNILVQQDGTIVLLDFGAVAELSTVMREGIPEFLEAVIKRDTQAMFRTLRRMGFIGYGAEAERHAERIVEYFHRRFQEEVKLDSLNLKDVKIDPQKGLESFLDLRRQDISIRELTSAFQVPKDWVLLERTVLLMGGVCTHLAPEMNPMAVIRPYLEEFVLGKDRDFATLVINAMKDTALTALSVPDDVRKYLGKAMRGELEMRFRGMSEGASLVYAVGHQLIYALFSLTAFVFSFVLYTNEEPRELVYGAAGVGSFFFLVMLASMYLARKYRRR